MLDDLLDNSSVGKFGCTDDLVCVSFSIFVASESECGSTSTKFFIVVSSRRNGDQGPFLLYSSTKDALLESTFSGSLTDSLEVHRGTFYKSPSILPSTTFFLQDSDTRNLDTMEDIKRSLLFNPFSVVAYSDTAVVSGVNDETYFDSSSLFMLNFRQNIPQLALIFGKVRQ
jgi:hypothetical protein